MQAIARFSMQGPRQAALMAVIFAALPLMYWISAAVVALVILRQGLNQGVNILLAALLPCVAWYGLQEDVTGFFVVLGCGLMAAVLRLSSSLAGAITVSVFVGILTLMLLPVLSPMWFEMLQQAATEYSKVILETMPESGAELTPLMLPMLLGCMAALLQLFAIGALLLARHWQAALFSPGEFSKEFQNLRLPTFYILVVVLTFIAGMAGMQLHSYIPIVLVPISIVGLGLVHGVVAIRKLSKQWLITFYIALYFMLPYMYALLILAALLDSLFDIRARLKDTA